MDLVDRATAIHFHRHRIARFGIGSAEALGWVDASSQRRRFDAIVAAADFTGCSVLDLGCGTGDLKACLDARFAGVSYLGIDQVPEFVAQARRRHADDAHARFELGDFNAMLFPRVDHVVACGSLSYRSRNPHHVFQVIARMFTTAARSVIFSVLDAARFPEHPLLVGHDVDRIVAFCRHLSPRVIARPADVDGDATVMISAALDVDPDARASAPPSLETLP